MGSADVVAKAMMEWAIEKGATHYTHWFQPLTGVTAEKHDSFLSAPDENGKEIKYTAVEITKVTGYVTGYSSDTFTVYNTLESLKPKTGDDSNLTLWTMLGLSALLCAGGVGILMYKKSRNAG